MRFEDTEIISVSNFIVKYSEHSQSGAAPVWFRGQSNKDWKLLPKLLRSDPGNERYLINKFKQNASLILGNTPKSEFEWLFLMQHYGIATRLLDWTESPLVGLYFACENSVGDAALWAMLPVSLNLKSHYRSLCDAEIPSFEDDYLINYLPTSIGQEIRSELNPMAAIALRNNPRIQAQQGVFTISHRGNIPIEDVGENGGSRDYIWRYIIKADNKKTIMDELSLLGINKFMLFPELDNITNLL